MLNVANVKNSSHGMSYYAKDNYYSNEQGVANSSWQGKGAEALGLSGNVDPEVFKELLEGKVDGQQLGKLDKDENGNVVINHLAAIDVTFSAPKSVSIMGEVYGDERIKQAHQEAVSEVLNAISEESISTRIRENGDIRTEQSDQTVIAKFEHNTNRLQEPDTHTHALILNVVKTEDGQWRSIDNREIYQTQRMYGAMYMNKLAEKVQGLGYDIQIKDDKGNFDIKGVGQEAIDTLSTRKKEIDEALAEKGLTRESASANAREVATLGTRGKKLDIAHEELIEDWKEKSDKVMEVDGETLIAQSKMNQTLNASQDQTLGAKEATRLSMKTLTEREAVFDERVLRQKAYERGVGTTTAAEIDKHIEELKKGGVVVSLEDGRATTKAVLNSEKWTIKTINEHKDSVEQITNEEDVVSHIASYEEKQGFKLTKGQNESVKKIFSTTDRFIGIQGLAGTGKTTMLEVVKNISQDNGYVIRGMSGTKKAANTLMKETGIESNTNTMFLANARKAQKEWDQIKLDNPEAVRQKELWIVDESSFAGQQQLNEISNLAIKADARVVFVGDKMQLQSIAFGKPFEVGQKRGLDFEQMKDINRQKNEKLKALVDTTLGVSKEDLNASNIKKTINMMEENGYIVEKKGTVEIQLSDSVEKETKAAALVNLVDKYVNISKEERDNSKVITPFNKDREDFNSLVRERLKEKGEIGKEDFKLETLKSVNRTSAELNDAFYYKQGEKVQFGAEVRYLGIAKNEVLTVTSIDAKAKKVSLQNSEGKMIEWTPAKSHRVSVYNAKEINLAEGDKVKFTKNDASENKLYANNTEATISKIENGQITVRTEDGREFELGEADKHIDHNYASTVYASQGSTYKSTYLYLNVNEEASEQNKKTINNIVGDRMFYVALTRSKEVFELHTNDATNLKEMLSAKQDKTFALGELEKMQRNQQNQLSQQQNPVDQNSQLSQRNADNTLPNTPQPLSQDMRQHIQQFNIEAAIQSYREMTRQELERDNQLEH